MMMSGHSFFGFFSASSTTSPSTQTTTYAGYFVLIYSWFVLLFFFFLGSAYNSFVCVLICGRFIFVLLFTCLFLMSIFLTANPTIDTTTNSGGRQ
jgi:hypothetical protein